MIEVFTDKTSWANELASAKNSDFYHTYDYHHLSKNKGEHPVLLKYIQGKSSVILPLLIRDIPNSIYKDATSVYGYAGPLINNKCETFDTAHFHKELNNYFFSENIVSLFSRLHTFFGEEQSLFSGLGQTIPLGNVVYIDLGNSLEIQRAKYNRRLKTYINKSKKSCSVITGDVTKHLQIFVDLYYDNMRRVNAEESYFFPLDYFKKIFSSDDLNSELLLCVNNETQEIIGGAIFIKTKDIVQYHLSGMNADYSHLNPIKLIIDTMRIKASEQGYKYLNLGGGKGSNEDSLFRFKSSFSKDFQTFKIWKHIVDEDIYEKLTLQNLPGQAAVIQEKISFFPAYRYKAKRVQLESE